MLGGRGGRDLQPPVSVCQQQAKRKAGVDRGVRAERGDKRLARRGFHRLRRRQILGGGIQAPAGFQRRQAGVAPSAIGGRTQRKPQRRDQACELGARLIVRLVGLDHAGFGLVQAQF